MPFGNPDEWSHRRTRVRFGTLLITVVLTAACGVDSGSTDASSLSTTTVDQIGPTDTTEPPPSEIGFIEGTVTAGPHCPVQQNPPDPACDDQPVAGATILVTRPDSATVIRLLTDRLGRFTTALEPGDYVVEPQPLEGLLGTPGPEEVRIEVESTAVVDFTYDTGIR